MKQNWRRDWGAEDAREGGVRCTSSGQILDCDQGFARMLGYEDPDALQATVGSLGDLFADRLPGAWRPLASGPEASVGEFRCVRRDGTSIWIALHARHGAASDPVLRFHATDVTSRTHLERQLQEARQLDLTGRISAGMTQDINNVISAVLAQVDLARGSLEIRDLVGVDRDLDDLRLTALRGAQMVQQMLSFNRGGSLELTTVDLKSVAGSAARLIRPLLPESLVFRVVVDDAPPVRADAAAVEQILIKLALYARDAMGDGGRLTIRVGSTRMTHEECRDRGWGIPGLYGSITISDTGAGLSEETVERLFEPFFAGEPGQARSPGMVVVYALMKQHRGFVEVTSRRGDPSGLAPETGTEVRLLFRPAASRALRPRAVRAPANQDRLESEPGQHPEPLAEVRTNIDTI